MINKHIKAAVVILLLGGTSVVSISCKQTSNKQVKQTKITFKKEGELKLFNKDNNTLKVSLDIEIAKTEYETQTGLMYRDTMEDNQGMLFIFDDNRPRSFYMKNTCFPLDIIYINDQKEIVSFQKNAQPFNESSLPSNASAKYVLEVKAGLADTWNLQIGDIMTFYEN